MAPGGYAWWYLDAVSQDGRFGLTIIAFVGSVFSPYYHWSGRRDPDDHCALNVSLYGPGCRRWTMTERPRSQVARTADSFSIGPSALHWDGNALTIDIAEVGVPLPRPVRGRVRVVPEQIAGTGFMLDPAGRHRWHPIAPRAHVEVEMDRPGLRWRGGGYLDSNFGDEPIAAGFRDWSWSRAHLRRDVAVLYEGRRRDGTPFDLALRCDGQGEWREEPAPPRATLPRTLFAMPRVTRADHGHAPRVLATWEDAPFYARSSIATRLFGEAAHAVHESLSLDRLDSAIVRHLLPYRMPRRSVDRGLALGLGAIAPLLARE